MKEGRREREKGRKTYYGIWMEGKEGNERKKEMKEVKGKYKAKEGITR